MALLLTTLVGMAPSWSEEAEPTVTNFITPTRQLSADEIPYFTDDLDFENMMLALERQLDRYEERPLNGTIRLGSTVYPQRRAKDSLIRFRGLTRQLISCLGKTSNPLHRRFCYDQLNSNIVSQFDVYMPSLTEGDPRQGELKPALFTAYYTPSIRASRVRTPRFKHAIYAMPKEERLRQIDRVGIDFDNKLMGTGYELVFIEDLFEHYIMQVQGGGRAVFEGKSEGDLYLSFAGTNGQNFRFISLYMEQKGYINNRSVSAQRDFLKANPDKQREIYGFSPGYVYFKQVSTPPLGSDSVPLTDNRSIATDSNLYRFKGLLSFVSAERPEQESEKTLGKKEIRFREFSRFFIDQDTGGAIRGKARADLYFGEGEYAELAANTVQNRGDIYFLMLKNSAVTSGP